MKKMARNLTTAILSAVTLALAGVATPSGAPENPATGIWIQQIGEIVEQPSTNATLYYTKYIGDDRVKSIDYFYDGLGYLRLLNKKDLCHSNGADGIMHHPDGDLIVAGQGARLHKVKKNSGSTNANTCVAKTSPANYKTENSGTGSTQGYWHVMVDPNHKFVWADGMPGPLVRYALDNKNDNGLSNVGYQVELRTPAKEPYKSLPDRNKNIKQVTTVIWDGEGNAFYTYSNYAGGGCETDLNGVACSESLKKQWRAGSHFGYFTDTTWKKINSAADSAKYLGHVGDSVVIGLGKITLIDSLEGAHGGTYDPYSNTIFIFGGSKIVQIEPYREGGQMKARVLAEINLRTFFFPEDTTHLSGPRTPSCRQKADPTTGEWGNSGQSGYCDGGTNRNGATPTVGWRLDQGTVDGHGHLFVASNTGHVIFIDYAANPQRLIDNNVLAHMQWIDNFLDDLAPLDKIKIARSSASTIGDVSSSSWERLSSQEEWNESSSSKQSSSSQGSSSNSEGSSGSEDSSSSTDSSDSNDSSSGSEGSSGSGDSSSSTGSSDSNDSSSGSEGSSGSGDSSSSTGSSDSNGSSSNSGGSSGSTGSSGSNGSSSSQGGGGELFSSSSSSDEGSGGGILFSSSTGNYSPNGGGEDFGYSSTGGGYVNPSWDDYDKGDSVVQNAGVLVPADDKKPGDPGTVTIGENVYYVDNNPTDISLDFRQNANIDSAKVGDVVAITLSADKVKEYFGDHVDSLTFTTPSGLILIDPNNPAPGDSIKVNADGSVTIYVTAYDPVRNGEIYITNEVGQLVVIDNINFFAVVPEGKIALIKDSGELDGQLDYVEILLQDTLSKFVDVVSVSLVVNGVTMNPATVPTLNGERNRIILNDVSDLVFPDDIDQSSYAQIVYKDKQNGATYVRQVPLVELGTNIIKAAHAIRDTTKGGLDSLFVEFNVDIIPIDLSYPEMLIALKQKGKEVFFGLGQVSKVYLPSKNIVIFVGENLKLQGNMKDSVSLYPNVTFSNAPFITSDEYDRHVPVTVVDRLPAVKAVEYWDTDYDGVMDQVVVNYSAPLKQEDLEKLHMTFPWYSDRGLLVQLQAQPSYLKLDPNDPTKVIWDVYSPSPLAKGVTSISESLPPATVYTYYPVFDEIFVNEDPVKVTDKMSPVIAGATLNYGKKADTLAVAFSEPIKKVDGRDYFRYIHGKDTLDLIPSSISWSEDGMIATLILDAGQVTVMPGDSLMVVRGSKGAIQDNFGNIAGDDPSPVIIGGLLNHLVESTKMGTFDDKDEILHTMSSVNLRYVPSSTTKEDLEKEGALGHLVQLGERFVPQLLDRAQIAADGSVDPSVLDSLDPEKVFISFVVHYFDHLGQYVNDTVITVPCNSPKFGGNCLNSDQKVFVNWNFKDHSGRFVGAGVYTVQFKMVVRYAKRKIEEEIKDKWGVRRKKKK
ncbi:MAG: hypothetical protein II819_07815 [Fibrobacter sp.]|nr:hypothetical protein [Fibrobacter sp.]